MNATMKMLILSSLLAAAALPVLGQAQAPDKNTGGTFVHTVFFWLKNPESEADQLKLLEGLTMLRQIPEIQSSYIGVPAPTNRDVIDSSYNLSITFVFDDGVKQDAYQVHPTHLKFIDQYAHLWDRVVVYDAIDAGSPKQ